jgi:tagaturonate epimerase
MESDRSHGPAAADVLGLAPSFGFGDRLGIATPGHAAALARSGAGILPIFAQQSIREMMRTGRTPAQVMSDALAGIKAGGYAGAHGADADHLKTPTDIETTATVGFTFFTLDPSENVDTKADDYDADGLAKAFKAVASEVDWVGQYEGKAITVGSGVVIELGSAVCRKAAVKYGRAINLAVSLAKHVAKTVKGLGRQFEIELSVDETPQPTTAAEHYIIADQCRRQGVRLVSLAPRFVGDFEKGVDFKGDRGGFERSLATHAAIARHLGPYKLSLHSGSDKLSVYAAFSRITGGMFHVKTAGTSYLEALRTVARHDEALFRRIIEFSRSRYEIDRATYHVSATLAGVPAPTKSATVTELETTYLGRWADVAPGQGLSNPGRQILHCTFGSVLTDPVLGGQVKSIVREHAQTYRDDLVVHFGRHLEALRAGM